MRSEQTFTVEKGVKQVDEVRRVCRQGKNVKRAKEHDALWVLVMAHFGWSLGQE